MKVTYLSTIMLTYCNKEQQSLKPIVSKASYVTKSMIALKWTRW